MFENIGFSELLIILLVVLVLFGAKRIPELAKGLGKGISEFKKGLKDVQDEINLNEVKETKTEAKQINDNLHKIS
ncbi:MAG: twin-arginine translocase TatA/TatE family subunit [Ignavibacteriaceae bacterium]